MNPAQATQTTQQAGGKLDRRQTLQLSALTALALLVAQSKVLAFSLADISDAQAGSSIKSLLDKSASAAVLQLGRKDGFLGNDKVRIGLPGNLDKASKFLSRMGQGDKLDELVTAMNRAAEQAVPFAKPLLVKAVKDMTVVDAKNILTGGDTSVTQFFASKTRTPLGQRFLPVVNQATEKVQLAQHYDAFAGKAASFGLVKKEDAQLGPYVTGKTLDGLYLMIGEEEKKIRQNPLGSASTMVQKVFGALP